MNSEEIEQSSEGGAVLRAVARALFDNPSPRPHPERADAVGAMLRDIALLRWLHAEAVWRLEMERLAHAVTTRSSEEHARRAVETDLEKLEATFHDRAQQRAEAANDGGSPQCDGDCGNGDCHTTSAVAAWQMAAAVIRRQITKQASLDGGAA